MSSEIQGFKISYTWDFGDDKKLAGTLKELVLSGVKTATTGLFREGKEMPEIGDYAAILDFDKKPFCVIQYTHIEVKPFLKVAWDFIQKEGEGDKDIEEWREHHRKFFSLKHDNVKVICEEFKLVLKL